jgi:hypothetical protein
MMLARCEDPDSPAYHDYGARGIRVCDRWRDPETFIRDIEQEIGPRPAKKTVTGYPEYSLDRIDNDEGYKPGNVRWATWKQQAETRRRPTRWKPRE